jgi:hypothetical protein
MRPDWQAEALCHGKTRLFFPQYPGLNDYSAALALCRSCPVIGPCRDWAMNSPDPVPYAVAGGMTYDERNQARTFVRTNVRLGY